MNSVSLREKSLKTLLGKLARLAILSVVVLVLNACSNGHEEQDQVKTICPALPKDFTKNDLIGTWVADYANGNIDIIIIREDDKYKQIFSSTAPELSFESDWQNWWIEQRDSGYFRLHLEGMHQCSDLESICQNPGGGIDSDLFSNIDYCEDTTIAMEREVILIVTGTQYNVPKGIVLRHPQISGSDWSYMFEYQP